MNNSNNDSNIEKRLYELERKQQMFFIGVLRALEKLGINQDDNLELFCMPQFSYEDFEKFRSFLVETSIKIHNNEINKIQFIDEYNTSFPEKKLLLAKLMKIVDKSDEFESICNLYFDKK